MKGVVDSTCWLCDSRSLSLVKPSGIKNNVTSESFAISDSDYGVTGALYRCMACGFLQCPELSNALSYYEGLRDVEYEASREQRGIQARKLLRLVQPHCPSGRLLDVGAGSGILVEQALELGYEAEGVEPSRWLQERAASRG